MGQATVEERRQCNALQRDQISNHQQQTLNSSLVRHRKRSWKHAISKAIGRIQLALFEIKLTQHFSPRMPRLPKKRVTLLTISFKKSPNAIEF
eukprot:1160418-Pelagomonas_calceolata.AAC.6